MHTIKQRASLQHNNVGKWDFNTFDHVVVIGTRQNLLMSVEFTQKGAKVMLEEMPWSSVQNGQKIEATKAQLITLYTRGEQKSTSESIMFKHQTFKATTAEDYIVASVKRSFG